MLFWIWLIGFVVALPLLLKQAFDEEEREAGLDPAAKFALSKVSPSARTGIFIAAATLTAFFWPITATIQVVEYFKAKKK